MVHDQFLHIVVIGEEEGLEQVDQGWDELIWHGLGSISLNIPELGLCISIELAHVANVAPVVIFFTTTIFQLDLRTGSRHLFLFSLCALALLWELVVAGALAFLLEVQLGLCKVIRRVLLWFLFLFHFRY